MKNLSLKWKIGIWVMALLIAIVALTFVVVLQVSDAVIQRSMKSSLIRTVEDDMDEVVFVKERSAGDLDGDSDIFTAYNGGYLEIDDDYLDEVDGYTVALYDPEGNLLYGENPIMETTVKEEFNDGSLKTVEVGGIPYYIYDKKLVGPEVEGMWLRGVVSSVGGEEELEDIARASVFMLPILILIAMFGVYMTTRKFLKPLDDITASAKGIEEARDLKMRIDIGAGGDEVHQLAETFNSMLERLDRSFENEQRFTSDVSHELRTPMSVITAQTELSLEDDSTAEEFRESMEVIKRQGDRMKNLINDMLSFKRLERTMESIEFRTLDMCEIAGEAAEDVRKNLPDGLILHFDGQEAFVRGERDLLYRAVSNLLNNAVKYGADGGEVFLSVKEEAGFCLVRVKDLGQGISEEDLGKIFERFYQADSSRASRGSGLGLSMVREIVEALGGTIEAESKEGEGSTFTISLPAASGKESASQDAGKVGVS